LIIFFQTVRCYLKKRSVNLHCSKVEVLAIPLKRDRQAHAMTKHSIDIALKSRFILKSASFLLWDIRRTNMLYIMTILQPKLFNRRYSLMLLLQK